MGAGASCEVLPLIKEMPKRLKELSRSLKTHIDALIYPSSGTYAVFDDKNWIATISKQFEELAEICDVHSSVDTYAKKLFIKKDFSKLDWLKSVLSSYFMIEMILKKGQVDKRYDNFWASVINTHASSLPSNLRIVTWNYDTQLEQSFMEYSIDPSLSTAYHSMNICDDKERIHQLAEDKFKIYKLNGTAAFALNKGNNSYEYLFKNFKDDIQSELLPKLISYLENSYLSQQTSRKLQPTFTYAWETTQNINNRNSILECVSNDIKDTNVLVVIGYSFPYFNREIDRMLLKESNIHKIYVQDYNSNEIITNLKSIFEDKTEIIDFKPVPVSDMQFFIPPEL